MRSLAFALIVFVPALAAGQDYARGKNQVVEYFVNQVRAIANGCLTDLTTKEDWEARRPELRRQFLDMMGLWPLPEKEDLHATVTGTVDAGTHTVEKLHFQSRYRVYVTANLYLPKSKTPGEKFPTILYVCGHGNVVDKDVSYGSKVYYQYHPAWFAAHGFACLALDTLQLSEIPATHHGTYRLGMWWWQARGYTPGGVELWNAIRALDYLETRPEVDKDRIGVTGRSGGGATTWWILAADDRPKVFAPVAGIVDLHDHLCANTSAKHQQGVIAGHCDCMFMVNRYRWDFPLVAALAAPRPLLLGNSDADDIFPKAGYRRLAEKVRKVYDLYGAGDRFQLMETAGPHKDTPELQLGINRWMSRWLKGDAALAPADAPPPALKPAELKVLNKIPGNERNTTAHDFWVPAAHFHSPTDSQKGPEYWAKTKPRLLSDLKDRVFSGWAKNPPPLDPTVAADVTHDGVRLRAIDFTSETAVKLRMFVLSDTKVESIDELVTSVLNEPEWDRWCAELGPAFAEALQTPDLKKRADAGFERNRFAAAGGKLAFAAIVPRGIGPTRWAAEGSPEELQFRRRFALIGQTLDGQRVWDVRRAVRAVQSVVKPAKLTLHGDGMSGVISLYAGLFEPSVAGFDLWHPPTSHHTGPTFLNVLKYLDFRQAVALAEPRPVMLHVKNMTLEYRVWDWPSTVPPRGYLTIKEE
jgi:dienelactone hydrolase